MPEPPDRSTPRGPGVALATLNAARPPPKAQASLRAARIGFGVGGLVALALGQPVWAMLCLFGAVGTSARVSARFPRADRRYPRSPSEASLLAMLPGRRIWQLDADTYAVAPSPGSSDSIELWHQLSDNRLATAWFDLELGPEPRVSGQAERVAPLMDAQTLGAPEGERLCLRGRWLSWSTRGAASVEDLTARIQSLGRRLTEPSARVAKRAEVLEQGGPLLRALSMLADPFAFESSRHARGVRPSWRWLARDGGVSRQTRLRAVRFLARCGDPDEVVDLLDRLDGPAPDDDLAGRAAHHLASSSGHVQVAALAVLEAVGAPVLLAAVTGCRAAERPYRDEVKAAVERAVAAIEARHGPVEQGALALVDEAAGAGALGLASPQTGPLSLTPDPSAGA